MARSFKKTPGFCDRNPWMKRYANKRVRQHKGEIPDGKRYKRLTCSWDICDWRYLYIRPGWKRRLHEQYKRPWQALRK